MHKLELNFKDQWIWIDLTANAFLQHMVRNIAGCLIEIGYGKRETEWLNDVLLLKDRTKAGITAPANGLYLTGVNYESKFVLPSSHHKVSFWGD